MNPDQNPDRRAQLLDALDFAYCQGLGYSTPEALLDAYDASRGVPVPPPADQTAVAEVRAMHQPRTKRYPRSGCVECGNVWPCPTYRALDNADDPSRVAAEEQPTETQWPGERCMLCPPDTRTRHLEDHMVQVHGARPTAQPAVGEQPETQETPRG